MTVDLEHEEMVYILHRVHQDILKKHADNPDGETPFETAVFSKKDKAREAAATVRK